MTHLSDKMRITRGNRGGVFVHLRPAILTREAAKRKSRAAKLWRVDSGSCRHREDRELRLRVSTRTWVRKRRRAPLMAAEAEPAVWRSS